MQCLCRTYAFHFCSQVQGSAALDMCFTAELGEAAPSANDVSEANAAPHATYWNFLKALKNFFFKKLHLFGGQHLSRGQETLYRGQISRLLCDAGNRTQVITLGNKLLYVLSHLADPSTFFFLFRQCFMKPRLLKMTLNF